MSATMMSLADAAAALAVPVPAAAAIEFSGVSTDSRTLVAGDLFVALQGPNFDGHEFVATAKANGAVAAIVSRPLAVAIPQLVVMDTRLALGRLAAAWRSRFHGPLVALTGSNGKTTVKEMIASILGQAGAVLATQGNLNNDIGVPLMLLRLRPQQHRFAVIEMGANHAGEIAYLTDLARPDVALINNAAGVHLEGFGSLEGVARGKGEIWQGLDEDGTAIVNADDAFAGFWLEQIGTRRRMTFGIEKDADVHLGPAGASWTVSNGGFRNRFEIVTAKGSVEVELQLAGRHNVRNALAATAAAMAAGATLAQARAGLNAMVPVKGRLQPKRTTSGALLLDDTYNANPQSLRAAMDVLVELPGEPVLVLGDMGELGVEAEQLHRQSGLDARARGIRHVFAVGPLSRAAVESFGADGHWFESQSALIASMQAWLVEMAGRHPVLLVKGSRSARMERVVEALVKGVEK